MPTRRRKLLTSTSSNVFAIERDWPSARAPRIISLMRFSVRRKVDLPQPEGPMRAVMPLSGISILMSCKRLKRAIEKIQRLDAISWSLAPLAAAFAGRSRLRQIHGYCHSFGNGKFGCHFHWLSLLYRNAPGKNKTCGDVGEQHHTQQHQTGRPSLPVPIVVRSSCVVINHHWQGCRGLVQACAQY